jgi:chromosome segregation ATPase
MAEFEGGLVEPSVRDDDVSTSDEPVAGLDGELGFLETRVAEAAELVTRLRQDRAEMARERESLLLECGELRRECDALRREREAMRRDREETAARLAQIIAKVDALRGEP